MPRATELVPVPLHSGVALCSAAGTLLSLLPAHAASTHLCLGGVHLRCFMATGTPKECGRYTLCSARSVNCVSYPQSLVQSRKAGITSALASSTLNNEELVGAGVVWGAGLSCLEG